MKDKRNCNGTVGKSSLEQHFHKPVAITFILCERQVGWQADEIQVNFKIFKVGYRLQY